MKSTEEVEKEENIGQIREEVDADQNEGKVVVKGTSPFGMRKKVIDVVEARWDVNDEQEEEKPKVYGEVVLTLGSDQKVAGAQISGDI